MNSIIEILNKAGYKTVEGASAVKKAIRAASDIPTDLPLRERLCSGYGVFPGGGKCGGCSDCNIKESGHE